MKKIKIVIMLFCVGSFANVEGQSNQTIVQTQPGSGNNVIPAPIYVDGNSTTTGIYIGHGANTVGGNNAIGEGAMNAGGSGSSKNTAVGYRALYSATNTNSNTAVGYQTLYNIVNTSGNNTAVGSEALLNNTGSGNTGIGVNALVSNSTGIENTAVGLSAAKFMNGKYNAAFGRNSMLGSSIVSSNTGQSNCAFGFSSMYNLTGGSENVALGYQSLYSNTSGTNNTAIGTNALNNTTGSYNIGIGNGAIVPNATSNYQLSISNVIYGININDNLNVKIGIGDFGSNSGNTISERLDINGKLKIRTVDLNTTSVTNYLYVDAGVVKQAPLPSGFGGIANSCSTVGTLPIVTNTGGTGNLGCSQITDNATTVQIGTGNVGTLAWYTADGGNELSATGMGITNATNYRLFINGWAGATGYIALSDKNYKTDIKKIQDPLEKISKLAGYTYYWKKGIKNLSLDNTKQVGLLAQEVEKVLPEAVVKNSEGVYGLNYNAITPLLIEGIKAQQTEIELLKIELSDMKIRLEKLSSNSNASIDQFEIQPNPLTKSSNITYKLSNTNMKCQFVIYDLQGKILRQINLPANIKEGLVTLNKNDLPLGTYILSLIKGNAEIQSKRILIID